jgi:hypothetical protein
VIDWMADRPATKAEFDMMARLAQILERHRASGAVSETGQPRYRQDPGNFFRRAEPPR